MARTFEYIWEETDIGRMETLQDYRGRVTAQSRLHALPVGRVRITPRENFDMYIREEMS